jgi:hypothetical protein
VIARTNDCGNARSFRIVCVEEVRMLGGVLAVSSWQGRINQSQPQAAERSPRRVSPPAWLETA